MSKLRKALQKAKEIKDTKPVIMQKGDNQINLQKTFKEKVIRNRVKKWNNLNITYTQTRIEKIDQDVLRRNKIFSLFNENQTIHQIDSLRTLLLSKLDKINGNSLLITSTHPGEGKTFTAINLGVSIAKKLDRTVLIIDMDLRYPWQNHFDFAQDFWGLKPEKGLADFLMGEAKIQDIILNPGIEKLTIIPAGKSIKNSSELLSSQRMEQFIMDVKNRYGSDRICIFDSPALLPYTDALVISHLIDAILLVVEAERTSPNELKKALGLLTDKPLLGTILNKTRGARFQPEMTIKKTINSLFEQFFNNFKK